MIPNSSLDAAAAELLALAVTTIFPGSQLLSAASDGFGFYYDFYLEQHLDHLLVPRIEEHIRGYIKSALEIRSSEMMRENAAQLCLHRGQHIKAELALQALCNVIPVVSMGEFCDLPFAPCLEVLPPMAVVKILDVSHRAFYLESRGEIEATRIYATVAEDKKTIKLRVKQFEAAKKHAHALLGQEMHLFSIDESVGNLGVHWLPSGVALRDVLQQLWRKELALKGFQFTRTERFLKAPRRGKNLGPTSLPTFECEGIERILVSSVSEHHRALFCRGSYRSEELPVRLAEWVDRFQDLPLHRLAALFVTRSFSADETHIFCSPELVVEELISSLQFIQKIINMVDVEGQWILTSPLKRGGASAREGRALQAMKAAMQACGIECLSLSPAESQTWPHSEAANSDVSHSDVSKVELYFYDALGRRWAGPGISVNFHLPAQQGLCYQKRDGSRHPPVVIECSFCGSIERLIAILLEQHHGWLPFWLAPEQFRVISVGEENRGYARDVFLKLQQLGYRVGWDCCSSYVEGKANRGKVVSLGAKIHAAESEKVPYLLILGSQEEKEKSISVRALAQESKKDPKNKKNSSELNSKASLSSNVSRVSCSLECFLQQLHDEGRLTVD